MELKDSVVVVTGACRRFGIELACGLGLAGCRIVVHHRGRPTEAHAVVSMIRAQGSDAVAVDCDLLDTDRLGSIIQAGLDAFGRVDALVNNASVFRKVRLQDIDSTIWEQDVAIHQRAPFFLATLLHRHVLESGERVSPACVVNITDAQVHGFPVPFPSYACAKASLQAQVPILARALAPLVRVNAVAPGPFLSGDGEDGYFAKIRSLVPLGKLADASQMLAAVKFLLEQDAVTGQSVVVDAGQFLL